MPETPRTWRIGMRSGGGGEGGAPRLVLIDGPEWTTDRTLVEKAPVDAERERMLGLLERYVDLIERYGAAIIEISNALATDVSDKGRVMRARTVIAGLAPDVKPDSCEHDRLTGRRG